MLEEAVMSCFTCMSSDGQRIKWRRNIAENFNRLSRVHEHYSQTDDRRQTTDRQTDGRTDGRLHNSVS